MLQELSPAEPSCRSEQVFHEAVCNNAEDNLDTENYDVAAILLFSLAAQSGNGEVPVLRIVKFRIDFYYS